ncbi:MULTISPECIES: hypothetical protein [unclassified Hyphomonas]|jgi:hypothetical protein|uniref:hypothetical protein n=1 Tax=unclassified Hyphomonas TaxID=2630699 RepID=UPI000458ADF5|nr:MULTISPECIES: hypothetical protein [unclassified Hyphomonas]KCZ47859.1 hypothetical protein HY17_05110 [Hyphomonas sp. CY54-11-8]RAN41190.1 hypothetical protein HY26_09960 [Hyphomonas sp. GM-8P]
MKNSMILAGALLAASLTGCIAVTGVHDEDAVRTNTDLAVRVCGGEANVKEVTEDGYRCQSNP